MMKKFATILLLAVLAAGCRTSTVTPTRPTAPATLADGSKVVAYLRGENTCYYLFDCIPLWCGNPARPNTGDYYIFHSKFSEIRNQAMLEGFAEKLNADAVVQISHKSTSTGIGTLWIVWTEVIETTGIAVDKPRR